MENSEESPLAFEVVGAEMHGIHDLISFLKEGHPQNRLGVMKSRYFISCFGFDNFMANGINNLFMHPSDLSYNSRRFRKGKFFRKNLRKIESNSDKY